MQIYQNVNFEMLQTINFFEDYVYQQKLSF